MTFDARLKQSAFVAPSGTRFLFDLDGTVTSTIPKNYTVYDFPNGHDSYVQTNGHGGAEYPISAIFSGENNDIEAHNFIIALSENGTGILEHPVDGNINVVALDIEKETGLTVGKYQSVVTVTFKQTITNLYPLRGYDSFSTFESVQNDFSTSLSSDFSSNIINSTSLSILNVKANMARSLSRVNQFMTPIASLSTSITSTYNQALSSLNGSIDLLVGTPSVLASQMINLIKLPGLSGDFVSKKVNAYSSLIESTIADNRSSSNAFAVNDFISKRLVIASCVAGASSAVILGNYTTKDNALGYSDQVQAIFNTFRDWEDSQNIDNDFYFDDSETYNNLLLLMGIIDGFIVDLSFSLKQERKITLKTSRNYIELCAELYGDITDDNLKLLVESNNLTLDEIFLLPKGRVIVYYI